MSILWIKTAKIVKAKWKVVALSPAHGLEGIAREHPQLKE